MAVISTLVWKDGAVLFKVKMIEAHCHSDSLGEGVEEKSPSVVVR